MSLKVTLSSSDCKYRLTEKRGHATHVFLGSSYSDAVMSVFGSESQRGDHFRLRIAKKDVINNLVSHYVSRQRYYIFDEGCTPPIMRDWVMTADYLANAVEQINKAFSDAEDIFDITINRQLKGQTRTFLTGVNPTRSLSTNECLRFHELLFEGDSIQLDRLDNGDLKLSIQTHVAKDSNTDNDAIANDNKALLRVGDIFSGKDDGEFSVIEVLPKIYRIKVEKTGKIRSVPKTVVSTWYDFYKNNDTISYDLKKKDGSIEHKTNVPIRQAATRPIRDLINETTIDDKYEHGYDGMLGAIARWLLDNPREEKPEDSSNSKMLNIDRLAVALRLFQKCRGEQKVDGWESFDAWAIAAREAFAKVDGAMLSAADFDYTAFMRKFVYSPTVANVYFKEHDGAAKLAVGDFLKENRENPHVASWYLDEQNLPSAKGFKSGVALNFMMKMRPAEFVTFSKMIDDMLVETGVLKSRSSEKLTLENYEASKSAQGQVLAKMHELEIGQTANDAIPADYLTVNEFAWWLSEDKNKNLMKEEVLKMSEKKIEKKPRMGERKLADAAKDPLMQRLMAALRTKPFAILAGHSGTGKSRMVRRLAYMTCNDEILLKEAEKSNAPGNYCMVQVKPNWHDSTDLIGYYSQLGKGGYQTTQFVEFVAKAYAYPETPFFVCLDEMNLAPVEHYFAEYLSAIESRDSNTGLTDALIPNTYEPNEVMPHELIPASTAWYKEHGLTIPKNLFVVGTVNMDETTHQFSRKVLDRAMTILMDEVKFDSMANSVEPKEEQLLDPTGIDFFLDAPAKAKFDDAKLLTDLNNELKDTPFVVAYRFANEFALYKEAITKLNSEADSATALDHMVLMKLLPRIHGEKASVKKIFKGEKDDSGIAAVVGEGLSKTQMESILNRDDEYLTFWP